MIRAPLQWNCYCHAPVMAAEVLAAFLSLSLSVTLSHYLFYRVSFKDNSCLNCDNQIDIVPEWVVH